MESVDGTKINVGVHPNRKEQCSGTNHSITQSQFELF